MGLNPQNEQVSSPIDTSSVIGLEGATVIDTESHSEGDNIGHEVKIKPDTIDSTLTADVAVGLLGDVTIPEVGNRVIIGYRVSSSPIVLGTRYRDSETIPDFEPGERIIGHPASDNYIRLQNNGTIHVESGGGATVELQTDGDVVVNDGSTKPVTDVTVNTTTDADGHVTDVSLNITRTSDVFIP